MTEPPDTPAHHIRMARIYLLHSASGMGTADVWRALEMQP